MRKPMEVYLSDLEWTKTHDNMGGVMGNIVFKDVMSYEEYRKLLKTTYFTLCDKDYITNIEQVNERLRNHIQMIPYLQTVREKEDYKSRVEKTIEYFKYQLENLDFYEDTKAKMLCAMGITLLQKGSDNNG